MTWVNWSGNKATSAQGVTPSAKGHFLQIGKTYELSNGGLGLISGKLLEEPRDNWVKLECVSDRKKYTIWVNINLMATIEQKNGAD